MNPWVYIEKIATNKNQQRYQALVAILDSLEEVGSFRAVPDSMNYLEQWAGFHEMPDGYNMTSYLSVKISSDNPMQRISQNVPVKAGDMIVFDSRLLHVDAVGSVCANDAAIHGQG